MGLVEKRLLAQLRDEIVPRFEAQLREIAHVDIACVVDWESFAEKKTAMENLESKALKPLITIFQQITKDDLGKEAVAEKMREIHFSQGTTANIADFTLSEGALTLPWDWEGWPGSFFPGSVREKIESLL